MKFAKIFENDSLGQILVRKDTDEKGRPSVTLEIHIEPIGYAKSEYPFYDGVQQDAFYNDVDENTAIHIMKGVKSFHDDFKQLSPKEDNQASSIDPWREQSSHLIRRSQELVEQTDNLAKRIRQSMAIPSVGENIPSSESQIIKQRLGFGPIGVINKPIILNTPYSRIADAKKILDAANVPEDNRIIKVFDTEEEADSFIKEAIDPEFDELTKIDEIAISNMMKDFNGNHEN